MSKCKPQHLKNIKQHTKSIKCKTSNTVENPWNNLFLKSLHEESVHVATGVEFARMINFFHTTNKPSCAQLSK